MDNNKKDVSRQKFLFWGISIASVFTIPCFFRSSKNKKQAATKTVKMLTQDGKLVEVNISCITGKGEKIKNENIHTWIKKPGTL
jgi:hypothetical protein